MTFAATFFSSLQRSPSTGGVTILDVQTEGESHLELTNLRGKGLCYRR
jgi:hypothetical protein